MGSSFYPTSSSRSIERAKEEGTLQCSALVKALRARREPKRAKVSDACLQGTPVASQRYVVTARISCAYIHDAIV